MKTACNGWRCPKCTTSTKVVEAPDFKLPTAPDSRVPSCLRHEKRDAADRVHGAVKMVRVYDGVYDDGVDDDRTEVRT